MIFVDMDGTLAKFESNPNYLEKMYERGFFRNLKPYASVAYINSLIEAGYEVCILSACINTPYCKEEKVQWLKQYMPKLNEEHMIFVKCGENKATAAFGYMQKKYANYMPTHAILIDDYSRNLNEWYYPYSGMVWVPIKYCNGRNDTSGNSYNYKVRNAKMLHKILVEVGEVNE